MYHQAISQVISVFSDCLLLYLFSNHLEYFERHYNNLFRRREVFLEIMYLFMKLIWHLMLVMLYLYIILSYIIGEKEDINFLNILVVKIAVITFIVEHIVNK